MLNFNFKLTPISIVVSTLISCLVATPLYAIPFGTYDVADFSHYNRGISLGSGVGAGNISSIDGFNTLSLSGDNEYVKTIGNLAGFTYQSDWSWMTIIQSNQLTSYRAFMRGKAWQDSQGDFDLRINADNNKMDTWHRSPGWVNSSSSDTAINNTDLVWLAGTYDYSNKKSTLYVNGTNVGEFTINPMDDRSNNNPLNINGQWAENKYGVGNIYGEGNFSMAQLILSQSLFSENDLKSVYQNHNYMSSNNDTWFDFRVENSQVPAPVPVFLLMAGLFEIGLFRLARKTKQQV